MELALEVLEVPKALGVLEVLGVLLESFLLRELLRFVVLLPPKSSSH